MTQACEHLDRDDADTACAAMDQQTLAGFEPAGIDDVGPGREQGLRQGRRIDGIEARRQRQHAAALRQRIFGIAAAAQKRTDRVADLVRTGVIAQRRDMTGDLHPQCFRRSRWRRIGAARLMQIGAVNARGGDLDENFTLARRGPGQFSQAQPVIRPGIFQGDCFHGPTCQYECAHAH